jgi:hypothetical protein
MGGRWLLLAVSPLLLAAGALVHELAHALAVVAQGGTVRQLQLFPSLRAGNLVIGRLVHDGVPGEWLVLIAPTILWTVIAGGTLLLLPRVRRRRLAEGLLFALVLLPLVDVSFGFAGLFLGQAGSDLYRAFHGHETLAGLLMNLLFVAFGALGWRRFRELAPGALSAGGFAGLYVGVLAAPWVLWCGIMLR